MKIQAKQSILFIGDSITDAGRNEDGEAAAWNPVNDLGYGYVALFHALISYQHPERMIRVINRGIGGNTVLSLSERWSKDVLEYRPDWLSICIGINDVWRQFDSPTRPDSWVQADTYAKTYRRLLERTREACTDLQGMLLLSPFVLERDPQDDFRKRMDEYGRIVRGLAADFDATFVDTQAALDRLSEHYHPTALGWDRIHVNRLGHMALAQVVLSALA